MIVKFASKWKQLGSQLNVCESSIRIIESEYLHSCEKCCRIMLTMWLEDTSHPTWGALMNALDRVSDNDAGLYYV